LLGGPLLGGPLLGGALLGRPLGFGGPLRGEEPGCDLGLLALELVGQFGVEGAQRFDLGQLGVEPCLDVGGELLLLREGVLDVGQRRR
jgi:hypothetical protein